MYVAATVRPKGKFFYMIQNILLSLSFIIESRLKINKLKNIQNTFKKFVVNFIGILTKMSFVNANQL